MKNNKNYRNSFVGKQKTKHKWVEKDQVSGWFRVIAGGVVYILSFTFMLTSCLSLFVKL